MRKRNFWQKFKSEYIGQGYSTLCGIFIVVLTFTIILFLSFKGIRTFTHDHFSVMDFLFNTQWKPDDPQPKLGAAMFIAGSVAVSVGAVVISTPISIALAVFMNLISPKLGRKVMQPALELFVGIPSVVYGWVGVILLVPLVKKIFGGMGFSLLSGMIVLSIMILPTIASLASDAIKTVPKDYIEASYGLGATRWQTIYKVIVPSCKSGILTGVVLGLSRAIGEALAVQMVIGNSLKMVSGLTTPTITLTSILTMSMANTSDGTVWNDALWSLALLLLIISFIFIVIIRIIGRRGEE
ncbi:MAG: phosphate ABC transporter permease subunit PstC [Clostridium sp.]|nr:phosphate ABC transporter permease subunit PstC [Clostridium sp.]